MGNREYYFLVVCCKNQMWFAKHLAQISLKVYLPFSILHHFVHSQEWYVVGNHQYNATRMLSCFSHVWLFVTLWTVAHQAPLSMRFSRQEYSGCHALFQRIFRTQEYTYVSWVSCNAGRFFTAELPREAQHSAMYSIFVACTIWLFSVLFWPDCACNIIVIK